MMKCRRDSGKLRMRVAAVIVAFSLVMTFANSAEAWFGKNSRRSGVERPLTKGQAKSMAGKLIRGLLQQSYFRTVDELAIRVQMVLLSLEVQQKEITNREFTDMVLNETMEVTGLFVVNQDPTLSIQSLDQKLNSYDDEWTSRKRGIMLGADYTLTGSIREDVRTDEKGNTYKIYDASLKLKDIRKDTVLAEYHVHQNKQKLKRTR